MWSDNRRGLYECKTSLYCSFKSHLRDVCGRIPCCHNAVLEDGKYFLPYLCEEGGGALESTYYVSSSMISEFTDLK